MKPLPLPPPPFPAAPFPRRRLESTETSGKPSVRQLQVLVPEYATEATFEATRLVRRATAFVCGGGESEAAPQSGGSFFLQEEKKVSVKKEQDEEEVRF